MPCRLPEHELIHLAATSNEEAFREVIRRFDRHITSVLRRYVSRRTDREDLRSEIIEKLLANNRRALRRWEPRASFGSYLATIAARHCMDWLTRRDRLPCVYLSSAGNGASDGYLEETTPAGPNSQPQHHLEIGERRSSLREAITALSSSDRLILYLRFDQYLSGVQIANFLGISHGAARQRLFRAIGRLEEQVRRTCPELMQAEPNQAARNL